MKYLIFSHAHPMFSKGGGELAAYNLYQGVNKMPGHKCWFVARCPDHMLHLGSPIAAINEQELLISGNADITNLTSTITLDDDSDFAEMLRHINPDVIHFHHYVNLGLEFIFAAKRILPNVKILLTLHEFIAICSNNGQMIKTNGNLCHNYSPRECSQCFPNRTPEDFFLREQYIKSMFNVVDIFISPSEFLKQRYVSWGMDENKITVIENGQQISIPAPPRELVADQTRNVFGFFGQVNQFKGVDILLQAIASMSKKQRKKIVLEIHGANLDIQAQEFQDKIKKLLKPLIKEGTVRWIGPYQPHEIRDRMANIDWVVVPSIWWENSPMVIQESFIHQRPLLVSNIGGMAEKVVHNVNGLHVPVGNAHTWAAAFLKCAEDIECWERLRAGINTPMSIIDCAQSHFKLVTD